MINPELLEYVKKQIELGIPETQYRKDLSTQGWMAFDVDQALAEIAKTGMPIPKSVPPPPPIQTPQPQVIQPQTFVPTPTPAIAEPVVIHENPTPTSHKSKKWIIVVLVLFGLLVGGYFAYSFYKNTAIHSNHCTGYFPCDVMPPANSTVPTYQKTKNTDISYNGKQYSFTQSDCRINGEYVDGKSGPVNWQMGIDFSGNDVGQSFDFSVPNVNSSGSGIYLQTKTNVAKQGVKIDESNKSANGYSTGIFNNISFVWDNINSNSSTFSGNGYIKFESDVKPFEDVCSGKQKVNGQVLNSSSPDYKNFCPTPVFPAQTIYFSCLNGKLNNTPSPKMRWL